MSSEKRHSQSTTTDAGSTLHVLHEAASTMEKHRPAPKLPPFSFDVALSPPRTDTNDLDHQKQESASKGSATPMQQRKKCARLTEKEKEKQCEA